MTASGTAREPTVGGNDRPMRVAVVIPTFNEAENLPQLVERLAALEVDGIGFIVVDDGSPDGTGELAERLAASYELGFRVIHNPRKMGLGKAYIAGFQLALDIGAEIVAEMDADLSHPPGELPKMLSKLETADVVSASRYVEGGGLDPNWSWFRKQLSYWGNVGIRTILGLRIKDATSGYKAFTADALRTIDVSRLRLHGFGFQAEVAYRCEQAGLEIVQHPYTFIERTAGKSKMTIGIIVEAFIRLSWLRLRG